MTFEQPAIKNAPSVMGYIFAGASIIFFISAGYTIIKNQQFLKNTVVTQGKIVDLVRPKNNQSNSRAKHPVVSYEVDSEFYEFTSSLGSDPPKYKILESVEVIYNKNDPTQAKINSLYELWMPVGLLLVLSFAFGFMGFGVLILKTRRKQEIEYLKNFGQRIETTFDRVEELKNITVNGRHPVQIVSKATDPTSGETIEYKSEILWTNPSDKLNDDPLTVIIDTQNKKKYYMELPPVLATQ